MHGNLHFPEFYIENKLTLWSYAALHFETEEVTLNGIKQQYFFNGGTGDV